LWVKVDRGVTETATHVSLFWSQSQGSSFFC
jgi:hypothetical protein